jgi:peroxiredoxin
LNAGRGGIYTRGTVTEKSVAKKIVLVAVLILAAIPLAWRAKSFGMRMLGFGDSQALVNKAGPEFVLTDLGGKTISTKDFRGKKKLVVSFWASWCGPCRMELPELEAFYQKYHRPESNFEVLAVSTDADRAAAEEYVRKAKLSFPVLLDERGKTQDAYGVSAIPMVFVIDEEGKVIYADVGYEFLLERTLKRVLGVG